MSAHAQLKSSQLHWSPPPPSWSQPPEHETDVQRTPGIGSQAASGTGSACALHAEQTAYGAAGGCSHENKRGWMDQNMARIEREAPPVTLPSPGRTGPKEPSFQPDRLLYNAPCGYTPAVQCGWRVGAGVSGWMGGCVGVWMDGWMGLG